MRTRTILHLSLVLAAFVSSSDGAAQIVSSSQPCSERLLATIEPDGTISSGSLEQLLAQAGAEAKLYVGWEIGRPGEPPIILHWQDAQFISLFEEKLFVQARGWRQEPQIGKGQIELPAGQWISLLSSDGQLVTRMTDKPEPIKHRVRSYWCLAG